MAVERIKSTTILKTSHFGEIKITPETIFYFENGVLGFENLKNFVLITEDDTVPFKWLLAIENPEIIFPVISPWYIIENYVPGKNFDLESNVLFSIVTLNDGDGNITANLKAPISLNVNEQTGEQIILPTDKYALNHIISQKK